MPEYVNDPDSATYVHVVNAEDIRPTEKPERLRHLVTRTITDIGSVQELFQQDANRIKAEVFISGVGTVIICHSHTEAQAALTGTGGNFGAQITCPGAGIGSIRYTDYSQARCWVVMTGASPVISYVAERC